jgi:hypothetical protein
MARSQVGSTRAARRWWLTFLMCCALMLSPVVTAFGEEAVDTSDGDDVVVLVTPSEESATSDEETQDEESVIESVADDDASDVPEPESPQESADSGTGEPPATGDTGALAEEVQGGAGDAGTEGDNASGADASSAGGDTPDTGDEGDSPEEGPFLQQQGTVPETTFELISVEDAGLEPETTKALQTLEASGEVSVLASTLAPVYETPENVVAVLVGSGVTYSNVSYTGATIAIGTFTGGTGIIGFEDGIILSTGDIGKVVGPNTDSGTSTDLGLPGDDDLSTIVAAETFDATVLTFDFVPSGNQIVFSYVFSSEEYNEYVNSGVNDVFAFFVNGENCATIGNAFVSIDTINNDVNSGSFIDNEDGHLNTEMDGLTVVLTCQATVTPGVTNTMKLAIADTGDYILDSNVFIQAKSFVVPTPTPTETPVTPSPSPSPSETPETPTQTEVAETPTPTEAPGTPMPTEHAGKPGKPHKHYTSYKQYVDECENPVPAVALAITSSSATGGTSDSVISLPNTGTGAETGSATHALVIAAAMGAGISLIGAIITSRGQRIA